LIMAIIRPSQENTSCLVNNSVSSVTPHYACYPWSSQAIICTIIFAPYYKFRSKFVT